MKQITRAALDAASRAFGVCESPIEARLAEAIDVLIEHDSLPVEVLIQENVLSYRVDLMLCPPRGPKVVIECDGHDFHERTKTQARRDKSRDRRLTAAGYVVLRFTGSEIWAQPFTCALEALEIANRAEARNAA